MALRKLLNAEITFMSTSYDNVIFKVTFARQYRVHVEKTNVAAKTFFAMLGVFAAFAANAAESGTGQGVVCFDALARFYYISDVARTPTIVSGWRTYKNLPGKTPVTYELSCVGLPCKGITYQVKDGQYHNTMETDFDFDVHPTEYERDMILLRQGDRVVIGSKTFTIGTFLGGGNSVHVYRVADRPNKGIRLPAVRQITYFMGIEGPIDAQEAYRTELKSMQNFVALEKKVIIKHTQIENEESDPEGRYAIVSVVNGTDNGRDFMRRLFNNSLGGGRTPPAKADPYSLLEMGGHDVATSPELTELILTEITRRFGRNVRDVNKSEIISFATKLFYEKVSEKLSTADRAKFHALVNLDKNLKALPIVVPELKAGGELDGRIMVRNPEVPDEETINGLGTMRQLVYDELDNDWIAVDWDVNDLFLFGEANPTGARWWASVLDFVAHDPPE
jgi:hypothetical protein